MEAFHRERIAVRQCDLARLQNVGDDRGTFDIDRVTLDVYKRQGKARLLIIDEFGYLPIDEEGSRLLFQIISDSYETRSIIYTTNIEFSGWGRVLGDKNMAAALIDRTVHHGRLIRFEGRSYRSEHALMTK